MYSERSIRIAVSHIKDPVARADTILQIRKGRISLKEAHAKRLRKQPMPREKSILVSVYFPVDDYIILRNKAERSQLSLSALIRKRVLDGWKAP